MIVKHKLDPANPPRLTEEERARLDAMTDDDIDYSDAPDQGATGWTRASAANPMGRRKIALSVEAAVAEFFKSESGGGVDQERVNQVLHEYVESQRKAS
jgi:uncharacterized protein (DUF4415 family)